MRTRCKNGMKKTIKTTTTTTIYYYYNYYYYNFNHNCETDETTKTRCNIIIRRLAVSERIASCL